MKLGKIARIYVIGTQGIFSLIIFTALGYGIGYLINKDSILPAILAVVGMLLGLVSLITYLFILLRMEERDKKNDEGSKD